jgi:hypothetical protein
MTRAGHAVLNVDASATLRGNVSSDGKPHVAHNTTGKLLTAGEEPDRPHIVLSIGGVRCSALVDAGAEVTEFQRYSVIRRWNSAWTCVAQYPR